MSYRGQLILTSTELVVEECFSCHIMFAMPNDFQKRALADHSVWFWCPNGHTQHYIGKTTEQLERDKTRAAEREATALRARLDQERAELAHTRNKLRAEKAAKTRARNRADRGVCQHCKRHFANVENHVKTCHPEALAASEA